MRPTAGYASFLAVLAISCGDGGNTTPATPPAAPAPLPAPPSGATPLIVTRLLIRPESPPFPDAGFQIGDGVNFNVIWDGGNIELRGKATLSVVIGDKTRVVDVFEVVNRDEVGWLRFVYRITAEDRDEDGLSVPRDALKLAEGAQIVDVATQIPVSTDLGEHALENASAYKVRVRSIAPLHRAKVSVFSAPSYSPGYTEGDWIRLVAEFEEGISVAGSPRLAIKIGEATRHADFSPYGERYSEHRPPFQQRFDYLVRADDWDEDGISIGVDAFDFTAGALLNAAGEEVEVEIYSVTPTESDRIVEPGRNLDPHAVVGRPPPRACTSERRHALAYGSIPPVLLEEWDGTPFLFYFNLVGLPETERADAEDVLDAVKRLSERIEDQIGYSILEVGGWLEEPRVEFPYTSGTGRCDWRLPGQIVGMVLPDSDQRIAQASPRCALWASHGPDMDFGAGTVSHEIFHSFGFSHHSTSWRNPGRPGEGVPMSVRLTGSYVDETDLGVSFADVDALRCIFPK